MNRNVTILSILGALVLGLLLGYLLGQRGQSASPGTRAATGNVVEAFRQAARQTGSSARPDCLKEKLGTERYTTLALNPNAATPEDQFKILPCPSE